MGTIYDSEQFAQFRPMEPWSKLYFDVDADLGRIVAKHRLIANGGHERMFYLPTPFVLHRMRRQSKRP